MRALAATLVALWILAPQPAGTQTSPSCAQLPNVGCVAGEADWAGTQDFTGATILFPATAILTTGADADSANTTSDSGMEIISSAITLLRGCADTQVLSWVEATDTWDCTAAGGSAANSFLVFGTIGTVTGGTTLFANTADVSLTENLVEFPMEVANFENMHCASSAAITGANTVTVRGRTGVCGAGLTPDADVSCQITAGATECSDTTVIFDVTPAGRCVTFEMVWSGSAETAKVSCSIERTG